MLETGQRLDSRIVERTVDLVESNERPSEVFNSNVFRTASGRTIRPKSAGQQRYLEAIANNVITFGIGPAGTGKSWLAVAMALQALQAGAGRAHHPHPALPWRPASASDSCPATSCRRSIRIYGPCTTRSTT